jgi:hypothetical protein
MGTVTTPSSVAVLDRHSERRSDREYDFALVTVSTVDGPDGKIRVCERFEALPRHNDVVAPIAVDSNDVLVARPDKIRIHTKCYRLYETPGESEERYLFDRHETWHPPRTRLVANNHLAVTCRAYHRERLPRIYQQAERELLEA